MAKKVTALIKLALNAGKANPALPVGPALGQHGDNIMAFCKEYNAKTQDKTGMVIPVEISVYEDRSFSLVLKTPPASVLISKAANLDKGSGHSAKGLAGSITTAQLQEIAKTKLPDLNCHTLDSAMRTIAGTARKMGVAVQDWQPSTCHLQSPFTLGGEPAPRRSLVPRINTHATNIQTSCRHQQQGGAEGL